jgi:hypothetical protein
VLTSRRSSRRSSSIRPARAAALSPTALDALAALGRALGGAGVLVRLSWRGSDGSRHRLLAVVPDEATKLGGILHAAQLRLGA